MNFEPVQPRHKLVGRTLRAILGVHHEEHVRESGAEVGAVRVVVSRRFRVVDVDALRAVDLDHRLPGDVGQACANGRAEQ